MKITSEEIQSPSYRLTLELKLDDAMYLRALTGGIIGQGAGRQKMSEIFYALDAMLPDTDTLEMKPETRFSDDNS